MMQIRFVEAAAKLRAVYDGAPLIPPLRDTLGTNDLATAYAIQEINTQHWLDAGRRLIGRKVGATSTAVQQRRVRPRQPALRLGEFDPVLCGMVLERNGTPASLGAGIACLGNPLGALWLARQMVKVGRPLKKGDLVLSGALGPLVTVMAGDRMDLHITGLDRVRVQFSGDQRESAPLGKDLVSKVKVAIIGSGNIGDRPPDQDSPNIEGAGRGGARRHRP